MNGRRAKVIRNSVGSHEIGRRGYVRKNGGLYATGLRRAIQDAKRAYKHSRAEGGKG